MQIDELINSLLPFIFPYGDFKIKDLLDGGNMIKGNTDIAEFGVVTEAKRKEIYDYLVNFGFANKRNDISPSGFSIELNDRGRKLKECGSLRNFDLLMQAEIKEKTRQSKMEKYSFWITVFIAFSTGIAAIYYLIQIFTPIRPSC